MHDLLVTRVEGDVLWTYHDIRRLVGAEILVEISLLLLSFGDILCSFRQFLL